MARLASKDFARTAERLLPRDELAFAGWKDEPKPDVFPTPAPYG
jgi:hypothetical protein